MNTDEILDQIERGLEGVTPGPWVFHPDTMRAIIDHIRELEERAEKAERERDDAIQALSEQARLRGEAEGRLAASEMAGVVDGWKARAEAAEAKVATLEAKAVKLWALLRPFISVAEWDIGESEDDEEAYQPMPARHAVGGVLRVKHFRAALKAMEATDE